MARRDHPLWGDGQLDLFGQAAPTGPSESIRQLGAQLPAGLRFGTSTWTFPGWAGLVYHRRYRNPQAFTRESLREYAEHPLFRTVGIDRSFYAPLTREELRAYASQLPPGFRCVMKVFNEITTRIFGRGPRQGQVNRRFLDADLFRESVLDPIHDAFADHQGPLVMQIPPAPGPVNARGFAFAVHHFLNTVQSPYPIAFELRDKRLFTPEYVHAIREGGGTHVYNWWTAMPSLPSQRERVGEPWGPLVTRLMIPPGKRYADLVKKYEPFDQLVAPDPVMRRQVCDLARETLGQGHEAFVIVNNKAEGSSPHTVEALARLMTRAMNPA